jgi:hypothetical protein
LTNPETYIRIKPTKEKERKKREAIAEKKHKQNLSFRKREDTPMGDLILG